LFRNFGVQTNCIQALSSDGFQVGSASIANGNNLIYHYFALKSGTVVLPGSTVEVDVWQSEDGTGAYEEGIQTFGDADGRMVLRATGIGIRTTAPSARLHLPAGIATASTAPLKFTSGVSLTAAEAGAIEFTTDDLFFTITTGAARKAFVLDDGARLTSGRIPAATTNGRLVDGPTPAADNTYANPTSITISKGIITAIS